jgi:LacI family transcriptional regulator
VPVSSFDDPVASWIRPPLTTLALPHSDLGRRAIDVLFGEHDHPRAAGEAKVCRVPMPLRRRDSIQTIG